MSPNNTFYLNKMQEIITDLNGDITHSNNTIYTLGNGHNIFEIHPFFQSLKSLILDSSHNYYTFPCINLDFQQNCHYCDVIIKHERSFIAFLLFNYSEHYKELQVKAQKIKEEKLKS